MADPRIAADPYPQVAGDDVDQPWHWAFPIVPSDTDELEKVTRAVYVGETGDVNLLLIHADTPILFKNAPQGFELDLRVRKVLKTGTTAASLVGLY